MTLFRSYKEIDTSQWDVLVQKADTATWFQTAEAYEFFASLPGEFKPFVYGVSEKGQLYGVVAGYVTQEKSRLKQFFTRRAIIIGGPLLDDAISSEALSVLLQTVRGELARKIIYIELRNLHDYSRWKNVFAAQGFDYTPHLNFQVDCTDPAAVLGRMKSNRRRQIRKGLAHGAYIAEAQSDRDIMDFYTILSDLYAHKVKTPLPSAGFFLSLCHSHHAKFLLIKYQDAVIGGIVCPVLANRDIYEWYICGLDKQYRQQYPSVLATYAAIDYAVTHNIALFDFMGAGTPDTPYGVRTFKSRFGGTQVENGRFLHIVNPFLYSLGRFALKFVCSFRG